MGQIRQEPEPSRWSRPQPSRKPLWRRSITVGRGRAHAGVLVRLLVANKHVRVIREDGSLLRELDLDPGRDYQPQKPAQIGHYHLLQTGTMT